MYPFAVSTADQNLNRTDGFPVGDSEELLLIGMSVCWGGRDAYYISLQKEQSRGTGIRGHTNAGEHGP